jgi:ketosteroid isomerase-like protein
VPWIPELFTAPAAERVREDARRARMDAIPYYAGLLTGDTGALVRSFWGMAELHHPMRGRVRGARALERFVAGEGAWLAERDAEVEPVGLIVTAERAVEEVVLHLDAGGRRIVLPVAIVTDRREDARIGEIRVYFSTWPLTGGHAIRPPLLQPDPGVEEHDVVGDYQRALAAGDVDAIVACFEPDGHLREPAGGDHVHRGTDGLRALFERFFSNGGGIPLEHCTVTDDGRACALEYNVVQWGRTPMAPEAGVAVYVRGAGGKLAAARVYDDTDPPL